MSSTSVIGSFPSSSSSSGSSAMNSTTNNRSSTNSNMNMNININSPTNVTPSIGAVIRGKAAATCMSYHEDGVHLFVTSESDSRLRLIDTLRGTSDRPAIQMERDGVHLVQATHHNQCVLYTGRTTSSAASTTTTTTVSSDVFYLSLHDNKILRQFRGGGGGTSTSEGRIHNLSMSPVEDLFLTSATDQTVRLYDIAAPKPIAQLNLPPTGTSTNYGYTTLDPRGVPCVSFDSTGLVFAVSAPLFPNSSDHLIHLYDARKYDGGPFAEFKIEQMNIANALLLQKKLSFATPQQMMEYCSSISWTSIRFNTSGKALLVTGDKGLVIVVDGFEGSILNAFLTEGDSSTYNASSSSSSSTSPSLTRPTQPAVACYTADDKMILCGNENGTIGCWDASTGLFLKNLEGTGGARINCIQANPKFAQFASACTNVALWLW